jgi:hypothetical protein
LKFLNRFWRTTVSQIRNSSKITVSCILDKRKALVAVLPFRNSNAPILSVEFSFFFLLNLQLCYSSVQGFLSLNEKWIFFFKPSSGGIVVKAWDQEVCSLCGLRFEPCGCSYDGYWRLTWSLTSGLVGLVEIHASWSEHPY